MTCWMGGESGGEEGCRQVNGRLHNQARFKRTELKLFRRPGQKALSWIVGPEVDGRLKEIVGIADRQLFL